MFTLVRGVIKLFQVNLFLVGMGHNGREFFQKISFIPKPANMLGPQPFPNSSRTLLTHAYQTFQHHHIYHSHPSFSVSIFHFFFINFSFIPPSCLVLSFPNPCSVFFTFLLSLLFFLPPSFALILSYFLFPFIYFFP